MKFLDLTHKHTYTKDGEEKVDWIPAGKMVIFDDGKGKITTGEGKEYWAFPQRSKEPPKNDVRQHVQPQEINVEDIPF